MEELEKLQAQAFRLLRERDYKVAEYKKKVENIESQIKEVYGKIDELEKK